MLLHRYNHPDGAGSTTSGGTESILMSCKTHRDSAFATKGITEPEMQEIRALGASAKEKNIRRHVDCCLGSFIVPVLERAAFPTKLFDFRVEGVTAISCDTHKACWFPPFREAATYAFLAVRICTQGEY